MVDRKNKKLSISRQCRLLAIHRSGLYYKPVGESPLNLELMRLMDEKHLERPFFGVPRMWEWLKQDKGYKISKCRIERLFKLMGIRAIYPKPNTSKPGKDHKIFPYLLKNMTIDKVNKVWEIDITYIPMKRGFMYLIAIIDVRSRYVVNWSISNSMEASWCCSVLDEAISKHGKPEIINTDQGSQFTSNQFVELVTDTHKIKLSMDGKGRALDNVYIERLWRSLKYEHVYLNPADDGVELYHGINEYFEWYNTERRHQGIDYEIPREVYEREENYNEKDKAA